MRPLILLGLLSCITGDVAPAIAADQLATADESPQGERDAAARAELDRMAARLEIRASQEPAWNEFAAAFRAFGAPTGPPRTAASTETAVDAATLMRERAARETTRAQQLTHLADAIAHLQTALSPDQRAILDQMARSGFRDHRMGRWDGVAGPPFDGPHFQGDWTRRPPRPGIPGVPATPGIPGEPAAPLPPQS